MQTKLISMITKYYMITTISSGSYNIYKNYNSDDKLSSIFIHGIIGAGMAPTFPLSYAIDKYNSINFKKTEPN